MDPLAPCRRPLRTCSWVLLAATCACSGASLVPIEELATPRPATVQPTPSGTDDAPTPTPPVDGGSTGELSGPQVAMYYGTGNSQGKDPPLSTLCQTDEIGIIILSFAHRIGSHTRNQDGYPEISINGCSKGSDARNPYLPDCTALGKTLTACQAMGKKVVLSLGGGGATVGFATDAEGAAYAKVLWDLVLGGNGTARPFGMTLDGIDLDIEGGDSTGYAALANALRKLMDADRSRKYLLTAAPQCIFPDEWLGPGAGTAFTDALTAFDYLFVQFYNNDCRFSAKSRFAQTWKQWTTLGDKQPQVLVGLPAASDAADAPSYVPASGLSDITAQVGGDARFGGFMFWDAGYDMDQIDNNQTPMRTAAKQALEALAK